MATHKEHAKACCTREHERVKKELANCDSSSRTEEQKHHCYRFTAWQSGRRAKRCADTSSSQSGLLR
jgi:hypothetical protein